MEQSILKSTKKILGVGLDDPSFDLDIITHINTEFSILTDVGVGPQGGFVIEDEAAEWESYFPEEDDPEKLKIQLSKVKACVWLRSKLLFDPPTSSYHLEAMKGQLLENEWRLNVNREATEYIAPILPGDVIIIDGGDPSSW